MSLINKTLKNATGKVLSSGTRGIGSIGKNVVKTANSNGIRTNNNKKKIAKAVTNLGTGAIREGIAETSNNRIGNAIKNSAATKINNQKKINAIKAARAIALNKPNSSRGKATGRAGTMKISKAKANKVVR